MKGLVIVPTYNEKENIRVIIPEILKQSDVLSVLVVDDNSPDGTGEIVDKMKSDNNRIHILHREEKNGLGPAYIAGFKWAIKNDFDYIFEMDADFSHNPERLPDFLESIKNNDLVIGSRYIKGGKVKNWPFRRLLLSYGASIYTRIITGLKIKDCTGGFKCFRKKVLESLDLNSIMADGYAFQIEVNYKVQKLGFRMKEIPITFEDRRAGHSKMSKKIVREAIWMVWKIRFAK